MFSSKRLQLKLESIIALATKCQYCNIMDIFAFLYLKARCDKELTLCAAADHNRHWQWATPIQISAMIVYQSVRMTGAEIIWVSKVVNHSWKILTNISWAVHAWLCEEGIVDKTWNSLWEGDQRGLMSTGHCSTLSWENRHFLSDMADTGKSEKSCLWWKCWGEDCWTLVTVRTIVH